MAVSCDPGDLVVLDVLQARFRVWDKIYDGVSRTVRGRCIMLVQDRIEVSAVPRIVAAIEGCWHAAEGDLDGGR